MNRVYSKFSIGSANTSPSSISKGSLRKSRRFWFFFFDFVRPAPYHKLLCGYTIKTTKKNGVYFYKALLTFYKFHISLH